MEKRLIFEPMHGSWRLETLTADDEIVDYLELTAGGVEMRFDRETVIDALRAAAAELENIPGDEKE